MKRVGIITFHRPVNVGSFLQSYALTSTVRNLGLQPEIIDFYSKRQQNQYSKLYLNNLNRKSVKMKLFLSLMTLLALPYSARIKRYYQEYHSFLQSNLPLSSARYYKASELVKNRPVYDIYISGSDQIWNVDAIDFSVAYLLHFAENAKRVAYAPSMGNKNNFSEKYLPLIKKYDAVSVREKTGASYMSKLTHSNIPYTLDPTLLSTKENYANLEQSSGVKGDYIFYYSIGYDIKQRILVNKIAKKHNLKVISWNPQQYLLDKLLIRNLHQPNIQNPGVWLSLIKNAKIVLSGSFHGSVFSVIYNKNFSILSNTTNSRLEIFNELGIDYQSPGEDNLPKIFSGDVVDREKLEELQAKSLTYLSNSIKVKADHA